MPYKSYAEFARTKGAKDKEKRKSRAGLIAGGIAGAGTLAAGARYGGAEIATRGAIARRGEMMPLDKVMKKGGSRVQRNKVASESGGAIGLLRKDLGKANDFRKGLQSGIAGTGLAKALTKERGTNKIIGKTLGGRIARGGGLLAAAGGTAAVLNYLKNRKKNKIPRCTLLNRNRQKDGFKNRAFLHRLEACLD